MSGTHMQAINCMYCSIVFFGYGYYGYYGLPSSEAQSCSNCMIAPIPNLLTGYINPVCVFIVYQAEMVNTHIPVIHENVWFP